MKADDSGCIPLCSRCHNDVWHQSGVIYGMETATREERRDWLRDTARAHYERYRREEHGDSDIGSK